MYVMPYKLGLYFYLITTQHTRSANLLPDLSTFNLLINIIFLFNPSEF